jgi:hypothetical protein
MYDFVAADDPPPAARRMNPASAVGAVVFVAHIVVFAEPTPIFGRAEVNVHSFASVCVPGWSVEFT